MNIIKKLKHNRRFQYKLLLILIIGGMLFFGIRLKDNDTENHAQWAAEGGLIFSAPSLAYTKAGFNLPGAEQNLTLDLILRSVPPVDSDLHVILLISDGKKSSQILLGIQNDSLILRKGSEEELISPLSRTNEFMAVRISSTPRGTAVYLNDAQIGENNNLRLTLPAQTEKTRLVLGGDMDDSRHWSGTLYSLALTGSSASLVYDFSGIPREFIETADRNGPSLCVPGNRPVLQNSYLELPSLNTTGLVTLAADIIKNLVGFIPLGALLYLLISTKTDRSKQIVMALVFLYSLYFETIQIWIPTRNSTVLDLAMNTLGGYLGIRLALLCQKTFPRKSFNGQKKESPPRIALREDSLK